jgi:hypothetical protein
MTARLGGALYWTAIFLALITFAGFGYRALQPNAFNPFGLVSIGAGLAGILWLAGLTCKYMVKSDEFVTQAVCTACGHKGAIIWKKEGTARKLVDSHCFLQRPSDNKIFCRRCDTPLAD